jgi:hypothetical protein
MGPGEPDHLRVLDAPTFQPERRRDIRPSTLALLMHPKVTECLGIAHVVNHYANVRDPHPAQPRKD